MQQVAVFGLSESLVAAPAATAGYLHTTITASVSYLGHGFKGLF